MAGRATVLLGFDQTRHAVFSIEAKLFGTSATATADMVAFHWMDEEIWQVSGIHKFDFVKQQGQWKPHS